MTNLSGASLNNGAAVGPQCEGRDSPSNFPKYSAYKDSGVEWLGAVPEGWELIPFKYVAEFVNGMAFKPEQWSEVGIPIIRIENLNNGESFNYFEGTVEERYHVKTGDLLFGWSGNRGTSFGPFLWHGVGLHYLNQHIFRIADFRCDKKWLYWALKAVTKTIEDQAHGIIGMVHVTKGKLGGIKIPLLPHPEQTQIARFLDHETARIDALIEEQQRLIELLKEKRRAVISHAVTKGLDPTVPMKDSGVEWLGEVPENWLVKRLKHLVPSITVGIVVEPSKYYVDEGVPALRSLNVKPGLIVSDNLVYLSAESNELHAKSKIYEGDIVAVRSGQPGTAAIVTRQFDGANCIDLIVIRKPLQGCSNFIFWYLSGDAALKQFSEGSSGAIQQHFNISAASEMVFAWPPMSEQFEICSYLARACYQLDRLVSEAEESKALLLERRSALISAAVTGKIDVRGWQPPAGTPSPESAIAEAH